MEEIQEYVLTPGAFDKRSTPFNVILKGEDVSNYKVVLNEKETALKDVFRLRINVKKVGTIFLLIPLEGFDREKAVEAIAPLKDIKVKTTEDAINKVTKLAEIAKSLNPLCVLYIADAREVLNNEEFNSLNWGVPTFYHQDPEEEEKEEIIEKIEELPPVVEVEESIIEETPHVVEEEEQEEPPLLEEEVKLEEPKQEKPVKVKKEKPQKVKKERKPLKEVCKNCWASIVNFFEPVKKNGFYYLFIFVAFLLAGFTASIGIYNCYWGKYIFIFFFVCSLIGAALSFFVYSDYFKRNKKLLSKNFYFSLAFLLLGMGLSLLSFFIYYILQKENPPSLTNVGVIYGILIGVETFIAGLSITLAYFRTHPKKR